ncbi:MAG: hypothetical protein LBM63_03395 [Rikenellaceae bacterium]|jgi:hypothetical protein|nr:hypothetical protein [Rikenellaceae bacterium]
MKKVSLIVGIALLAGTFSAAAETAGRIINAPYFDISKRILFSQTDYVFGTSRSMSMGGAFTSLGADLSSMNINPAGLGMYQSSDIGITQGLSIVSARGYSPYIKQGNFAAGGKNTSYGLDNVGAVFNTYNASNTLTSFSVGFSYNRAANFNSRTFFQSAENSFSIADMFGHQLAVMNNEGGLGPADFQPSAHPWENDNIFLDEWGAVLGYQTGMINNRGGYYEVNLGAEALTDSYTRSITKGGIYDYSLSMGANIGNKLYVGATLGTSQIEYKETLTYQENYYNQEQGAGYVNELLYDQMTDISGTGVNLKLGAIVRPVEALRVGIAFHLPTYYTINSYYTGEMSTDHSHSAASGPLADVQRFNTAPRLLVGASVIVAERAVLAVDYERTWYNKIHTRSPNSMDVENSREESAMFFKAGNALRGGAEFLLNDAVSLRVGGGYQFNVLNDLGWLANTPIAHQSYNITAGVGFNVGRNGYIDIAYMFKHTDYTAFENFYYDEGVNWAYQYGIPDGSRILPREYGQCRVNQLISLTFGSRF